MVGWRQQNNWSGVKKEKNGRCIRANMKAGREPKQETGETKLVTQTNPAWIKTRALLIKTWNEKEHWNNGKLRWHNLGFAISTFQHTSSAVVSRHQKSGRDWERERERLAGRQLSLMGEFKASRLCVYVTHAPFHITYTNRHRHRMSASSFRQWDLAQHPGRHRGSVYACVWYRGNTIY